MPGDPHSRSKVWKAPDREIGKTGENRGKIVAHWEFQPASAAKLAPPHSTAYTLSHQLLNFRTGTPLGR